MPSVAICYSAVCRHRVAQLAMLAIDYSVVCHGVKLHGVRIVVRGVTSPSVATCYSAVCRNGDDKLLLVVYVRGADTKSGYTTALEETGHAINKTTINIASAATAMVNA